MFISKKYDQIKTKKRVLSCRIKYNNKNKKKKQYIEIEHTKIFF